MARFVLSQKQSFDLMKHVEEFYSASGLGDKEFAENAANTIPLAGLNENHVLSARKSLGLQPNVRNGVAATKAHNDLVVRIEQLEQAVTAQSQQILALQRTLHLHPQGVR